jgi:hypothetical protein
MPAAKTTTTLNPVTAHQQATRSTSFALSVQNITRLAGFSGPLADLVISKGTWLIQASATIQSPSGSGRVDVDLRLITGPEPGDIQSLASGRAVTQNDDFATVLVVLPVAVPVRSYLHLWAICLCTDLVRFSNIVLTAIRADDLTIL